MRKSVLRVVTLALAVTPAVVIAQGPKSATYITDEEIKKVNALPGVDRQIRVVDIGSENLAVGIVHRGPTGQPPAGGARPAGGGQAAQQAAPQPCGETGTAPAGGVPGGIAHNSQTESYIIVSGGGTLVTGGKIYNGRASGPDSEVTKTLNGPSCSGMIAGPDVVKKVVKTGDIIIIPAGTPHGWTEITDHVDYLSIRPSDHVLQAGYVNPAIK